MGGWKGALRIARCAPLAAGLLAASNANAETPAGPEADNPHFLTLTLENDNYTPPRQDRHYTNGMALSYGFPGGRQPAWLRWLGRLAPLADRATNREYDIAVGQNLYTPEAFARSAPIPEDRPFAGWLYGELSTTARAPGTEERLAFSLGVVGPAALGETTQKRLHDLTGDAEPQGWHNQLDNEPALLLRWGRSWFTPLATGGALKSDLVSRVGLSAGNVVTEAGAGVVLRLGSALFERDVPQRLQPGLSGLPARFDSRANRVDWSVFAGAEARAVLRNLFLDGNTFKESPSVDREVFVPEGSAGFSLVFGQLSRPAMLSFTFVWRGEEFDGQRKADKFGSAQISVQF